MTDNVVVQPVTNYTIVTPVTTAVSVEAVTTAINVEENVTVVNVESVVTSISVAGQGQQGIQGIQGPQGPSGAATGVFYTHTQNTPTNTWVIVHNLGNYPTALVYDSSGNECEGSIIQNTTTQMTIVFSAAFSGVAYII